MSKSIIFYVVVFLLSFVLTPVVIKTGLQKANKNAEVFLEDFIPNTSKLPNGIYIGEYKLFNLISLSKIEFEIENGKVKHIELKKLVHLPGSAYKENIENQIRQSKKLEVDAITGATRSSNFAKAAIKDALRKTTIYKEAHHQK